ncbi:hypothetical protein MsAg5_16510 [Methanosarcinaceae archaeon Ag5]|uniref:Uncharacterized protein n=1 Tax=Methanolapillus africanus TaxID=3028297 RepID=A0AAE4MKS0_9EURY|nr:hypothetical protein [Methanosarcinaceae archaeon Ag5]
MGKLNRDHVELIVVLGVISMIFLAGLLFINLNQPDSPYPGNNTIPKPAQAVSVNTTGEEEAGRTGSVSGSGSEIIILNSGESPSFYNSTVYNMSGTYIYVQIGRTSDVIITGTVLEIQSPEWNTPDGNAPGAIITDIQTYPEETTFQSGELNLPPEERIYTDVVIEVANVYKGKPDSSIVVRTYAGTVGNLRFESDVDPEDFAFDEEYFLFLENDSGPLRDVGEFHYVVSGPSGRILLLENDTGMDNHGKIINMKDVKKSIVLRTQTISGIVIHKIVTEGSE